MISIRIAQPADISTIRCIAKNTWPKAYGEIISEEQIAYMLNLMYSEQALQSQFETGHIFLLAMKNEKVLGFAGLEQIGVDIVKLHKLYVLPSSHGNGIGKALIDEIIKTAKAANVACVQLNVNRNNPAKDFYQKMGFAISETVDIAIGEGYFMNDYVMSLRLDG
jgi:ribosomal protein S18 acetylase RimI-like enzyme